MARFQTSRTCKAGGRESNEDYAKFVILRKRKLACWVIADGLGGHKGGEAASKLAGEVILKTFKQDPQCSPEALCRYLNAAQGEILRFQEENLRYARMRTTVVVMVSDFKQVLWAHIGDSRFYHLRQGKILFQSKDHSMAQARVDEGEITPDRVRHHKDRNRLLRSMGKLGNFRPQVHREKMLLAQGDAFLLCTDGFWEHVEEIEMEMDFVKARTPRAWLQRMEKRLLKKVEDEFDNYTALAVYFHSI